MDFSNFMNSWSTIHLFKSDKYKFVYFVISKNGCSSILTSIFKYEYPEVDFNISEPIWEQLDYDTMSKVKIVTNIENAYEIISEYKEKEYKFFTIIRNPIDKFISWVNHGLYFGKYYNYNNEIKSYPTNVRTYFEEYEKYFDDLHVIPQTIYLNIFKEICGDNIDIIDISNLKEYFFKLTGKNLIINNENKYKIITRESLTKYQYDKILEYIEKYENHYSLKNYNLKTIEINTPINNQNNFVIVRNILSSEVFNRTNIIYDDTIIVNGKNGLYGLSMLEKIFIDDKIHNKYDYVIIIDEDCMLYNIEYINDLIIFMNNNDIDYMGFPDGGEENIIRHYNENIPNLFFVIIKTKKIKDINQDSYNAYKQSYQNNDDYEPYYMFFNFLNEIYSCKFKKLKFKFILDKPTTELIFNDKSICLHTWYSRLYNENESHKERINRALDYGTLQRYRSK